MAKIGSQSPTELDPPIALGVFAVGTVVLSWSISFVLITDTAPEYTTLLSMLTPATVALGIRRFQGSSVLRTISSSLRGTTGLSIDTVTLGARRYTRLHSTASPGQPSKGEQCGWWNSNGADRRLSGARTDASTHVNWPEET